MLLNTGGFWSGSGVPSDMVQDDLGEGAGAGALGTGDGALGWCAETSYLLCVPGPESQPVLGLGKGPGPLPRPTAPGSGGGLRAGTRCSWLQVSLGTGPFLPAGT